MSGRILASPDNRLASMVSESAKEKLNQGLGRFNRPSHIEVDKGVHPVIKPL